MFNEPYKIPISVKGIVFDEGKVWLRKNQRDEWELPGGKMDEGEQPEETCKREILEELGLEVDVHNLVDAHLYTIRTSQDESHGVFVVSYLCELIAKTGSMEHEWEEGKADFKQFRLDEIDSLNMPEFYKEAIKESKKYEN